MGMEGRHHLVAGVQMKEAATARSGGVGLWRIETEVSDRPEEEKPKTMLRRFSNANRLACTVPRPTNAYSERKTSHADRWD
jgi:hypothetical protein